MRDVYHLLVSRTPKHLWMSRDRCGETQSGKKALCVSLSMSFLLSNLLTDLWQSTPSERQSTGDDFTDRSAPAFTDGETRRGKCSQAIPPRAVLPTPIGTICELDDSGCVCLGCDKAKRSQSEELGKVCFENGTCTTCECLNYPNSPGCATEKEKRSEIRCILYSSRLLPLKIVAEYI